jgi:hypothetical protein
VASIWLPGRRSDALLAWLAALLVGSVLVGCPVDIEESLGRYVGEPDAAVVDDAAIDTAPNGPETDATAGAADGADAWGPLESCQLATTNTAEAVDAGLECPANETSAIAGLAVDGGVTTSHASKVPGVLVAGQAYSYSYDRVLPINVGQPVTVDVYGSNEPDVCTPGEKLFTMVLDGSILSWNKTYCFTPTKSYAFTISNVSTAGVVYYNSSSFAGTICPGCM